MAQTTTINVRVDQPKYKRRHLTTAERLKTYNGDYKSEEWDTGEPVGREVF